MILLAVKLIFPQCFWFSIWNEQKKEIKLNIRNFWHVMCSWKKVVTLHMKKSRKLNEAIIKNERFCNKICRSKNSTNKVEMIVQKNKMKFVHIVYDYKTCVLFHFNSLSSLFPVYITGLFGTRENQIYFHFDCQYLWVTGSIRLVFIKMISTIKWFCEMFPMGRRRRWWWWSHTCHFLIEFFSYTLCHIFNFY